MIPYVRNLSCTYAMIKIRSARNKGQGGGGVHTPPPSMPQHRMVATFCTVFVAIVIIIIIDRKINLKIQSLSAPVL